jgi:hypothetical protein
MLQALITISGDGEIRTLDTVSRIHTFQACSFNHSDTSPGIWKPSSGSLLKNGWQKYSFNTYLPNIFWALAVVIFATSSLLTPFTSASFSTTYFK